MTRRNTYPNKDWRSKPNSAYSRSDSWTTRYYHRKTGDTIFNALGGLNMTDDDSAMNVAESSYLMNVRLGGTKEPRTRAQSMSRPGQAFRGMPKDSEVKETKDITEGQFWHVVKEYASMRFTINHSGRMTQYGFFLRRTNDNPSNAYFLAILRDPETTLEICRMFMPVSDLTDNAKLYWFRPIRTLKDKALIELTLMDDMNDSGKDQDSGVEVLMAGYENHDWAEHGVPNLDKALREEPYNYERGLGIPLTSVCTTDWETFPVWIQRGYFAAENKRWIPVGVRKSDGKIAVYKYPYLEITEGGDSHERITDEITELIPSDKINQNAKHIRMVQAGTELEFVDGYSKLQHVDLTTWEVKDSTPTTTDLLDFVPNSYYYKNTVIFHEGKLQQANVDFQATDTFNQDDWTAQDLSIYEAWPGASLIYFLNNRLYLGGFYQPTVGTDEPKSEPTLTIMSCIDGTGPQYDFFKKDVEFFHSPDRAPASTTTSPITAYADLNDNLIIFHSDMLGFFSAPSGIEFGDAQQITPEGSGFGVLAQEHVCQGRNNVYFYNPTEGVMRLGGTLSSVISHPVDVELSRITVPEDCYMSIHKDALRFYYHAQGVDGVDRSGGYNNQCLYDYTSYATHSSYWFRDDNTPVAYMNSDVGYDVEIGVGSEYPCVIEAEVLNSSDFDCAIAYEYHTRYVTTPGKSSKLIVRRVHVTSLQDFNASLFIGLDINHEDNPIVWRRFIAYNAPVKSDADDVFADTENRGSKEVSVRITTNNTDMAQIRVKQYCYRSQAGILRMSLEYGEANNL